MIDYEGANGALPSQAMEPRGGSAGKGHGDTLREAKDMVAGKAQESKDTLSDKTRQSLKKEAERLLKVE